MQTMGDSENAPRYYQLILQEELLGGWSLICEWGAQGTRGRHKRENFSDRGEAEQALLTYRDTQLQRGYQVVYVQGEEASS
jgi:predicted DNA-binding WGR domain protein